MAGGWPSQMPSSNRSFNAKVIILVATLLCVVAVVFGGRHVAGQLLHRDTSSWFATLAKLPVLQRVKVGGLSTHLDGFNATNPTLWPADDGRGYDAVLRHTNFVSATGKSADYTSHPNITITRNVLVKLDEQLRPRGRAGDEDGEAAVEELLLPPSAVRNFETRVIGLEDLRYIPDLGSPAAPAFIATQRQLNDAEVSRMAMVGLLPLEHQHQWFGEEAGSTAAPVAALAYTPPVKTAAPVRIMSAEAVPSPVHPPDEGAEKNWMPILLKLEDGAGAPEPLVIYSFDPFLVYRMQLQPHPALTSVVQHVTRADSAVVQALEGAKGSAPPIVWGPPPASSSDSDGARDDEAYLMLVHYSVDTMVGRWYQTAFLTLDKHLAPVRLSPKFRLCDDMIQFACGLAPTLDSNGDVLIGYGVKDSEAWVVRVDARTVSSMLAAGTARSPLKDAKEI